MILLDRLFEENVNTKMKCMYQFDRREKNTTFRLKLQLSTWPIFFCYIDMI
jgi:hypothetical protein